MLAILYDRIRPDERMLFTGMSIGYEDTNDAANTVRTSRAPSNEWLTQHG